MKKLLPLFVVFATFLSLTSCEKDGLTYNERRAVGVWEFDRVTEDGRNITDEFEQQVVSFNADFSATYENGLTGTNYNGVWDLVQNNSGETCTNSIFASFTDPLTNEVSQLVLNNTGLYKNRITASFRDGFQNYRYRLVRR